MGKLIRTDTLFYKIKIFFKKRIFKRLEKEKNEIKEYEDLSELKNINEVSNFVLAENDSLRKEIQEKNRKERLLNNLLDEKIDIKELSEAEIDEMSVFIEEYINNLNRDLNKLKQEISNNIKNIS